MPAAALADDELIAELTEIPGIGPWTAQGALIIALGREDEVLAIAENWRPYRSLATAYLFSAAFSSESPGSGDDRSPVMQRAWFWH